jgi:hypothetical protein
MERRASTAECIERLSSSQATEREEAARELFRQGCAAAEPALRQWFANPEFRALIRAGRPLLAVGIAVTPARFEQIRAGCGQPRLAEMPPGQDACEFEMEFAHGVRIDVLTTLNPGGGGAIARFLARYGEGIQQVECNVADVRLATQILRDHFGLEPISPDSERPDDGRAGADGTRVNFFLVPVAEGRKALIELVENPSPKSRKR